jgi:hypothetical protein
VSVLFTIVAACRWIGRRSGPGKCRHNSTANDDSFHVYDAADNVIEKYEHKGDFKER